MPLSAQEAVGILNTFQNMRLSKENASRSAESYGKGMLEHGAGADTGAENLSPEQQARMVGEQGVPQDIAGGSLRKTETNVKQAGYMRSQKSSMFDQLDAWKTKLDVARMNADKNPAMKPEYDMLLGGYNTFKDIVLESYRKEEAAFPRAGEAGSPASKALDQATGQSILPYTSPRSGGKRPAQR